MQTMITICDREAAYALIGEALNATNGKMFSVGYIKADGTFARRRGNQGMMRNNIVGSERGQRAAETRKRNHPHLFVYGDMDAALRGEKKTTRSFQMERLIYIKLPGHPILRIRDEYAQGMIAAARRKMAVTVR